MQEHRKEGVKIGNQKHLCFDSGSATVMKAVTRN